MIDVATITLVALSFLLAGTVKGVIGLGLPTVSLALFTVVFDLTTAMALLLVPSLVTNIWQALVGGHAKALMRRLWPLLLTAAITIGVGAQALKHLSLSSLTALLGGLLMAYAALSLSGYRFSVSEKQQSWLAPLIGLINGVLTGMTGSFVVPGVMYLQAIGLSRDQLIQSMGLLFTVSTIALAMALQANSLLTLELGLYSSIGLIPAIIGMLLGQRIRQKLSQVLFRQVFYISLLILGSYILLTSL